MAKLVSNTETDLSGVDLNAFLTSKTGEAFQNNVNVVLGGVRFADVFTIKIVDADFNVNVQFYGQNLTYDAQAKLLSGGTISGYRQIDNDTGENWTVTGINVSATSFMNALKSPGNADDFALIARMFQGNDTMILSKFVDDFHGYTGNDWMEGNGANDKLFGDRGNDTLVGGLGSDTLSGGADADRFFYNKAAEGRDKVSDFSGIDKFVFKASGFGVKKAPSADYFLTRAKDNVAQDSSDHFIFKASDKTLWFDLDGDGASAPTLIVDLTNTHNVTAGNILIV
jgi:Ca2+-binding RTX toxin-like protein